MEASGCGAPILCLLFVQTPRGLPALPDQEVDAGGPEGSGQHAWDAADGIHETVLPVGDHLHLANLSQRRLGTLNGRTAQRPRLHLGHVGFDKARIDAQDVKAAGGQLGAEGARELAIKGLGAGVDGAKGVHHDGREGGNVDDQLAARAAKHVWQERLGEQGGVGAVDGDGVRDGVICQILQQLDAALADANVVDQDGNVAGEAAVGDALDIGGRDGGGVRDDHVDLDLGRAGLQSLLDGLQLFLAAADENEIQAVPGEDLGKGESDAVRGACDDGPRLRPSIGL